MSSAYGGYANNTPLETGTIGNVAKNVGGLVAGAASYVGAGISFIGEKVTTATGYTSTNQKGLSSGTMQGFGSEDMQRSDYYNPPGGAYNGSSEIIRPT